MTGGIQKPYSGSEPYIFVSYAHKDKERVIPVLKMLCQRGFRVWYDEGIDPGTEWDDYIAEHVYRCGCMIAFLSANYVASDNCRDELNFARDLQKERLLIYLEETTLPMGMAMRLNRLQAIYQYVYSWEDFAHKLCNTGILQNCLEQSAAQPEQPDWELVQTLETVDAESVSDAQPLTREYYTQGEGEYRRQNYAEAVSLYEKAANLGDPRAQCALAGCYAGGRGVTRDAAQAAAWYEKAALQGYAKAQNALADLYRNGRGVERDEIQAAAWYEKAARQGYAKAQFNLGLCYSNGWGVAKDDALAMLWYQKAARQGHADAKSAVGACYEQGLGVEQDHALAMEWYQKAIQ